MRFMKTTTTKTSTTTTPATTKRMTTATTNRMTTTRSTTKTTPTTTTVVPSNYTSVFLPKSNELSRDLMNAMSKSEEQAILYKKAKKKIDGSKGDSKRNCRGRKRRQRSY
jgi:hypothetical protein